VSTPLVSVIIPAYESHQTLPQCFDGLRRQTFRDFEVILVNSSPDPLTAEIARREYPDARFRQSSRRLLPHAARNLGAGLARGELFVFTDPDCRLAPDCLEWIVRGHREGHHAIGGAIENAGGSAFIDAVHIAKFAWWLPGGDPGHRPDIPTALAAYSRELWQRIGPFRGDLWCGDTLLALRLRALGERPWFEPRALLYHIHEGGMRRFLDERFSRGRDFGIGRPRQQSWSRARALVYLLGVAVLPLIMTARSLRYARHGRSFVALLRALPVVFAGNLAWCAGEAVSHAGLIWNE
jgi:glycosyltransferase involved in cell wall biosynthesis